MGRGRSPLTLTRTIDRYLSWPADRLAAFIAPTNIRPNVITWSALFLNFWAGVLFAQGRFAAAGGMMIVAGTCDLLDGRVARLQKRVSPFGGFLDSILDRYADLILFLGLLVYYAEVNRFLYAILVSAALSGAVMVSYSKSRAASLVPVESVGFWERPERLVLMILGALSNRMELALWILAIGPNLTVIHRIVHTRRQMKDAPAPRPLRAREQQRLAHGSSAKIGHEVTKEAARALTRSAGHGG